MLATTLKYLNDTESLRSLDKQILEVKFDHSESLQSALDLLAGKNDAKSRAELATQASEYESILPKARAKGGPTFAIIAGDLIRSKLHSYMMGESVDFDVVVQLADEAYAAAPSKGSRYIVIHSLLMRACHTIAGSDPKFSALTEKCKRNVAPWYLVAWAVSNGDLPAEQTANPDIQRAMALRLESFKLDPDGRGIWDWALLHRQHPEQVDLIVKEIQADETDRIATSLFSHCSPYDTTAALDSYWHAELNGKPEEGAAAIRKLADIGLPMPDLKP